jgi:hypothetical protein
MNILTEIVEKSDDIIAILSGNDFFRKNPFCQPARLRIELQIRMQRKWEQEDDMNLTPSEMEAVIDGVSREEISEVLYDLVDRGILSLSVNQSGELLYALSKESVTFLNKGSHLRPIR